MDFLRKKPLMLPIAAFIATVLARHPGDIPPQDNYLVLALSMGYLKKAEDQALKNAYLAGAILLVAGIGGINIFTINRLIEECVQPTVKAIISTAGTGEIGDGKVFVLDFEECHRIRTGETGSEAIG